MGAAALAVVTVPGIRSSSSSSSPGSTSSSGGGSSRNSSSTSSSSSSSSLGSTSSSGGGSSSNSSSTVLVVVVVLVLEVQVAVVVVVVVIAVVLVVAVVVMVMVEVVEVFFPQNVTNSSSILRIQSLNLPLAVKVLQHFPYDCSKEEASSEWMALAYGLENQTLHFSRQNSQRRWNPFNVKTKPLAWTESI